MTEEQKPRSEVVREIESLGEQIVTAVRSLWESEESRKLRSELGEGFAELGRQIETATRSAQESEAAKQLSEQVKETVDKARQADIAGKLESGLLTGLRELNEGLAKLIKSLEPEERPQDKPEDESQA